MHAEQRPLLRDVRHLAHHRTSRLGMATRHLQKALKEVDHTCHEQGEAGVRESEEDCSRQAEAPEPVQAARVAAWPVHVGAGADPYARVCSKATSKVQLCLSQMDVRFNA